MSLLISSAPAASSAAAAASASVEAFCACASALAWASSAFTWVSGDGTAGPSAAAACSLGAAGVASVCGVLSFSWTGVSAGAAAAAEEVGLSWSENIFNCLRDLYPCFLSCQSLRNPYRGNARRVTTGQHGDADCVAVTRSLTIGCRVQRGTPHPCSPARITARQRLCQSMQDHDRG